jgi:hypothetical protein
MSQKLCAKSSTLRSAVLRLSLVSAIGLAVVALGNTGCEDKAIGRPCDVLTEAGPAQGVYNSEALECPSRICLKPVVQQGASSSVDTGPYCSASCSQDSDCEGQLRVAARASPAASPSSKARSAARSCVCARTSWVRKAPRHPSPARVKAPPAAKSDLPKPWLCSAARFRDHLGSRDGG